MFKALKFKVLECKIVLDGNSNIWIYVFEKIFNVCDVEIDLKNRKAQTL